MVRLLRVKRLMLQDFSWLFPKWRWHSFRSQMLLHVAMITWLSIWRLFDPPDTSLRRICRIDAMFRIFARILTSVCAVLIRRPGGSVHVIRCSHLFLWGSWLQIGPSWFVALEDLSFWCDVPSFSATISSSDWVVRSSGFCWASNFKKWPSLFDYYLCYPVE